MLVLSRHVNEEIIIAGEIRVVVVGVFGGKVKLGITAPKDIPIHRQEVYDEIQRQRKENQ